MADASPVDALLVTARAQLDGGDASGVFKTLERARKAAMKDGNLDQLRAVQALAQEASSRYAGSGGRTARASHDLLYAVKQNIAFQERRAGGTSQSTPPAEPSAPSVGTAAYCGNCGAALPEGVRFCPSCGAAVVAAAESRSKAPETPSIAPAPTRPRKASSSSWGRAIALFAGGLVVLIIVIVVAVVASSNKKSQIGQSASSAHKASQVVILTRYRPGYSNTSCLQMPGSASVRFFIYTHNKGNTPAGFNQDVHAVWLDLNGKTVDAFQNTMLAPLHKVQPHLYNIIYSDFPANGEQPIIKCWIRVGDSTTNIPIHVIPAG